jgi:hypothetical protein
MAVAGCVWLAAYLGAAAQESGEISPDHPAIRYSRPASDPVARFLGQPDAMSRLTASGSSGYLRSLLQALAIPVESQILVFSKGSLQSRLINAGNPRALYFNDSVAVGWVRGGFIEIAAQDPSQGTVFYLLDPNRQSGIVRTDESCLSCHFSGRTKDVPGMIESMSHTRPLEHRWGGWYVTGRLGTLRHFGNADVMKIDPETSGPAPHLLSLDKTFDVGGYLTPHSDVAALLVFEHQMQLMNLLTRLGWEARVARHDRRLDVSQPEIRDRIAQVVDYMLFVDEAAIGSKIEGSTAFARLFSARGPRDPRGRSLYEMDLTSRLFRYPCSYMIYSEQFDALPADVKTALYRRLWAVLSGADGQPKYRHLSAADRRAITEILRATKEDLPRDLRR